jgi:hypothetical protein
MPRTPSAKATVPEEAVKKVAVRKVPAKKVTVKISSAAGAAVKTKKSTAVTDSKPYFRFYPAMDLHSRLIALLDQIEDSSDATLHRVKLSESVNELTTSGLDYYFVRTLKEAKVGFVTQQSANLGLMGVQQVMAPVIRNIIGRLEHAQLQAIAQSIRQLMK